MAAATAAGPQFLPSAAQGAIALLREDDPLLQVCALKQLKQLLEVSWMEAADALPEIEALAEDEGFPERALAACVCSRLYFHLDALSEAAKFALSAQPHVDLFRQKDLYEKTVVAECIEEYVRHRVQVFDEGENVTAETTASGLPVESLERVVLQLLRAARGGPEADAALGVCLEARRIREAEELINADRHPVRLLNFVASSLESLATTPKFREEVLCMLVRVYRQQLEKQTQPQVRAEVFTALGRCLLQQKDVGGFVELLVSLIKSEDATGSEGEFRLSHSALVALQIAFDADEMCESAEFRKELLSHPALALPKLAKNDAEETPAAAENAPDKEDKSGGVEKEEGNPQTSQPSENAAGDEDAEMEAASNSRELRLRTLYLTRLVLSGEASRQFRLLFLKKKNRTDLQALESLKGAIDSRVSLLHHGLVICHGLQQAGTCSDVFLRRHLDWMTKACNWARYSTTASLGVVHRGNELDSLKLLNTYLPGRVEGGGAIRGGFSEGGALYALGLIHAGRPRRAVRELLLEQLQRQAGGECEALLHGAAIGLGLLMMATGSRDSEAFEALKGVLFLDNAVSGEAAAFGLGLLYMGTGDGVIVSELLSCARETQHEKVGRACALGAALVAFQRRREASQQIEEMLSDSDPLLRYGGVFAVGLANYATGQKDAIRLLLHFAVADVSDDVRRGSVMALGFVLAAQRGEGMRLLCGSFNPHVRYGACVALGMAAAGSGEAEAVSVLKPLCSDPSDFGRNVVCQATSAEGVVSLPAAAGLFLFCQFWYWHAFAHCISLAFKPAALIGLVAQGKKLSAKPSASSSSSSSSSSSASASSGAADVGQTQVVKMEEDAPLPASQEDSLKGSAAEVGRACLRIPTGLHVECAPLPASALYPSFTATGGALLGGFHSRGFSSSFASLNPQTKQQLNDFFGYPAPTEGVGRSDPVKAVKAVLSAASRRGRAAGALQKQSSADNAGLAPVVGKKEGVEDMAVDEDKRNAATASHPTEAEKEHAEEALDSKVGEEEEYIDTAEPPKPQPKEEAEPEPFEPFTLSS